MKKLKDFFNEEFISNYNGKNLVVYFYPKDNTPGCTTEAIDFTEKLEDFKKINTNIIGISKDTEKSHEKFIKKHNLKIELISDSEKNLHDKFDVIKPKKMFGKDVIGTERSTFIFNSKGELVKEYRKVRVKNHVNDVYDFIKENLNA